MSKKKKKPEEDGKFGLNEPTGQFDDLDREMKERESIQEAEATSIRVTPADVEKDVEVKQGTWKGIDDQEEEEVEDDVQFEKKEIPEDELDMTPMVDVTFLLLIFFMVTASFTLQKSLEQPHAKSDEPSLTQEDKEELLDDYIQVTVDQNNTFYVTTRDDEEVECPSDSEMRARVKDAKDTTSATRLIIVAHIDSTHGKVITAWDTGVVNNMNEIEIQTTDEEY